MKEKFVISSFRKINTITLLLSRVHYRETKGINGRAIDKIIDDGK